MKAMEKYRIQQIAKSYPSFKPEIVAYGDQILYEMEMDLKAMVQAISYLSEYIEYRKGIKNTHTFGDNTCNQALELLIKRVSVYSCPNNKKEQFKTKTNCPLKENCKCLQDVAQHITLSGLAKLPNTKVNLKNKC
jgi:hypothetical protein